jgi:hypothetical protein
MSGMTWLMTDTRFMISIIVFPTNIKS